MDAILLTIVKNFILFSFLPIVPKTQIIINLPTIAPKYAPIKAEKNDKCILFDIDVKMKRFVEIDTTQVDAKQNIFTKSDLSNFLVSISLIFLISFFQKVYDRFIKNIAPIVCKTIITGFGIDDIKYCTNNAEIVMCIELAKKVANAINKPCL